MQLRILGCSGTYPTSDTPSSGYVLENDGTRLWIDAGTGTFAELQTRLDYTTIDAIVISHIHSDHCLDLFPLYYARRFNPNAERIPIYCPDGTMEHLSQLLVGDGNCTLDQIFDFREIAADANLEIGSLDLTFMRTQHPIPTHAIRCHAGGKVFTFSSDTGPDAAMDEFARGSDTFLCEATYQNDSVGPPLHLSAAQAAEFAKRADARSLILTHLFPGLEPAVSIAEAREVAGELAVHAAHRGGVYDIESQSWIEPR